MQCNVLMHSFGGVGAFSV